MRPSTGLCCTLIEELCAMLFPRAEPADALCDELAYRDHRRQTDRAARRQDSAPRRQPAAAPPEVAAGVDRLPGVVSRSRSIGADPVRQLCAGSRRQIVARLPADRRQQLVPADLPDPPLA